MRLFRYDIDLNSFLSSVSVQRVSMVAIIPTHRSISGFAMRAAYIVVMMIEAAITFSCFSSLLNVGNFFLERGLQPLLLEVPPFAAYPGQG